MFNFEDDHWVAMAMAENALVADQLLRIRHHRHSVLPRWAGRQRRTLRLPIDRVHPARASPTTPLTWTAATSVDGYEGFIRPAAPPHASQSKAVDQNETAGAKRSKKKRTLVELLREEKLKLTERKDLKDELAAMNLSFEKQSASNESLKRIKLNLMSRDTLKAGEAVLDPPETVEASNLASAQTFKDKVAEDVCAAATASASSNQQEISDQEPSFLLPDLNLPVEEDFCDIRGLS